MSGVPAPLSAVPPALYGASAVISGNAAPLASPSTTAPTSTESSALAGAALDRALDGYCAAFAGRVSTVAAGLVGAAGAYTANEATSSRAMSDLAPIEEA